MDVLKKNINLDDYVLNIEKLEIDFPIAKWDTLDERSINFSATITNNSMYELSAADANALNKDACTGLRVKDEHGKTYKPTCSFRQMLPLETARDTVFMNSSFSPNSRWASICTVNDKCMDNRLLPTPNGQRLKVPNEAIERGIQSIRDAISP